jgi:hypothetical protein
LSKDGISRESSIVKKIIIEGKSLVKQEKLITTRVATCRKT